MEHAYGNDSLCAAVAPGEEKGMKSISVVLILFVLGIVLPSPTWAKYEQSKILQRFEEMVVKNATFGDPKSHPNCKNETHISDKNNNIKKPCYYGVITKYINPIKIKIDEGTLHFYDFQKLSKELDRLSNEINFPISFSGDEFNIRIVKINKKSNKSGAHDVIVNDLIRLNRILEEAILEYAKILQSHANCFGFEANKGFEKLGGLIVIEDGIDGRNSRYCILTSITRFLGGSGRVASDSVLDPKRRQTFFSPWDRFALSLLYDPTINLGDSAEEALKKARLIVVERNLGR